MPEFKDRSKEDRLIIDIEFGDWEVGRRRITVSLWMKDATRWGEVVVSVPKFTAEPGEQAEMWQAFDAARHIADEFYTLTNASWMIGDHKNIPRIAIHRAKMGQSLGE